MGCPTGTFQDGNDCRDNSTYAVVRSAGNNSGQWSANGNTSPNGSGNNGNQAPKKSAFDWANMLGAWLPTIFTGVAVLSGKASPQQQQQQQQSGGVYNPNSTPPVEDKSAPKTWWIVAAVVGGLAFIGLVVWLVRRKKTAA